MAAVSQTIGRAADKKVPHSEVSPGAPMLLSHHKQAAKQSCTCLLMLISLLNYQVLPIANIL